MAAPSPPPSSQPPDLQARLEAPARENEALRARLVADAVDEPLFQHLVEATGDVVWITECEPERVVFCSARFESIWGHSVQALYDEPSLWVACIHPEDRERVGAAFGEWIARPAGRWRAEFRIVRPDGQVRWIHERGVAMPGAAGGLRVIGASRDVTAQRETAAALRASEERFALAVAGSTDGIWDWDLRTDLMYMSERAQELFGILPGPVTLRPRGEWLSQVNEPQPDVQERRLAIARFITGEAEALDGEWRFRQPGGSDRWRRVRGRCLRDERGLAVRMSGSISDTDARRAQENALRESEERFSLAVAGSNDGIWDWDIASGIQYYSERAQRIYGLVPGPTKRHRSEWRRLVPIHPDDYHDQINAVTDYLAGRTGSYGGQAGVAGGAGAALAQALEVRAGAAAHAAAARSAAPRQRGGHGGQ